EHANVSKWMELELPADPATTQKLTASKKRIADLQAQLKSLKAGKPVAKEAVQSKTLPGIVVDDSQAKKVGDWKASTSVKPFIDAGYVHDDNADKGKKTVTFTPELPSDGEYEVRLSYTPGTNRSTAVPVTIFGADGEVEKKINQQQAPTLPGGFVSLGMHRFEKAGQSFVIIANEGTTGHVIADAVQFLPKGTKTPETTSARVDPSIARLEKELKEAQQEYDQRPTRMGVKEQPQCSDCKIHIRGQVGNQGDVVPRGFLQAVSLQQQFAFTQQESGRRQLAQRDNPLTARVIVNRVWLWLMGEGLCRTPDNFGTTGEKPVHPELLDYLALRFMHEGWSIKKLIRHIVLSHAYQSVRTPRRLEAEALRDRLLVLSGTLDLSPPNYAPLAKLNSDYHYVHQHRCRSVYLPAFRNSPEPFLEAFDLADPSTVVGQRNVSTVAPQALYLMNHAEVHRHCQLAVERLLKEVPDDAGKQIDHAYRLTLGRLPTAKEKGIVERTLALQGNTPKTWTTILHALVCSLDFRYVE
ncbi:MAG TPA: DUF1553 domain-containing protein, partial [Gemmatales bacterium]|nr:DUF1553 domain-containing protein [Gemmatales bacterium]